MKIKTEGKRDYVIITYTLGENSIDEVYEVFKHVSEVFSDKHVIVIPNTMNVSEFLDDESAIRLLESVENELRRIERMGKNKSKKAKRTEFQIMRSRMAKLDYQMKKEIEDAKRSKGKSAGDTEFAVQL